MSVARVAREFGFFRVDFASTVAANLAADGGGQETVGFKYSC